MRGDHVRAGKLATALAAAFVLAGCGGGGSGEVGTSTSVAKADVDVDADLSWASCRPVSSSEPDTRPSADYFADEAPENGDLIPGEPVVAAFCTSPRGTGLELSGSSLDGLVNGLNHAPRYDGDYDCTAQAGPSNLVVFRYDDGGTLPVLLSRDSCGWADNGAQLRYAIDVYLWRLDARLDKAAG
jgi:hypothetical protein